MLASKTAQGYLLGICAIMFWSANVIISRWLAGDISPAMLSFGRWCVAALVLLPFTAQGIRSEFKTILNEWKIIVALGFFSVTVFTTLVYKAGETATAIDMALIGTAKPIFLALFSALILHSAVTLQQILGLCCAMIGVLIVILHGDIHNLHNFVFVEGDLWMLLSAATFALYSILLTFKPRGLSELVFLEATIISGIIMLSPFVLWDIMQSSTLRLTHEAIGAIIYMGIFQSVLAFLCWTSTLRILGNLRAGVLFYTMPLVSSVEAYFFLNESLQLSQLIGGIFVLAGVIYAALGTHPDVKTAPRA